ncbi:serine hydrolase [Agrococcus sp. DT81.2]|uniref:serine hydrolase n=1 Tax=Agrococcus sp. DT81.2 TaxID=3393414 RepID=UPI003CE4F9A4
MSGHTAVDRRVREALWPFVEQVVEDWSLPAVAVCAVHRDRVLARGFGTADRSSGARATADTLFHLASVSKTFVAVAVLQLVESGTLELDAPITSILPALRWADPRAEGITPRLPLSHRSGLGDVSDYGWHQPELDDDALARFAARVAGWPLERDPGSGYRYSNAGFELLGHVVATVGGAPFEQHLRTHVLEPAGMAASTFLRDDVPHHLAALPHVGLPARVPGFAYPYTRSHAPSSSLHSSAAELGQWLRVHLARGDGLLSRTTHDSMWRPCGETGKPGWHSGIALGWFRGEHRGHAVVSHPGSDPGFQSSLVLLPELGIGAVALANANAAPVSGIAAAAVDVLLGLEPGGLSLPPVTARLAPVLASGGVEAAADLFHRIVAEVPSTSSVEDDEFEDAVWGAIELHRTDLARPVLELWQRVRPESSAAWRMSGWAAEVDGRPDEAATHLRRALALDPGNDDARAALQRVTSAAPPAGLAP